MHRVKILNIEQITHNVKSFTVAKPDGYKFTPGQATDVAINKPGWTEKKHSFTFTSLNSEENLEFTIKGYPVAQYPKHEGVTEEIHKLNVGDELLIEDPWGTISYKGVGVFLAAGAGITPFIAIFRDLNAQSKLIGNKLIFSNKTNSDVILQEELKQIFAPNDLILTLTREANNNYEHGRIDEAFLKRFITDFNQHFYLCGPGKFVVGMKQILADLGTESESIVFEE